MITKLLDSQSFSKVWKTAVRQKFCAIASKIWSRNIICRPLRGHILFAYPTNWEKITSVIWSYDLKRATQYVKSVFVWNASFRLAFRSFKTAGPNNSTIFNGRIDQSQCFEVITSQQLQHVLHSYKHKAFQKVKCKLDLIEQPFLDKIHSRLRQQ